MGKSHLTEQGFGTGQTDWLEGRFCLPGLTI